MAYMAKIETQNAQPIVLPISTAKPADFSALEWSVIRLARVDRLWTIRAAGRLRRFLNWIAGRGNPAGGTAPDGRAHLALRLHRPERRHLQVSVGRFLSGSI